MENRNLNFTVLFSVYWTIDRFSSLNQSGNEFEKVVNESQLSQNYSSDEIVDWTFRWI